MQDVPQLNRKWEARDRMLRCRQTRQAIEVALAAMILALLPVLVWLKLATVG